MSFHYCTWAQEPPRFVTAYSRLSKHKEKDQLYSDRCFSASSLNSVRRWRGSKAKFGEGSI